MPFPLARRAVLLTLASLVVPTSVAAGMFSGELPADLDLSLVRPTLAGLYTVELAPVVSPVKIGRLHAWNVHLADSRAGPSMAPTSLWMVACPSTATACLRRQP